IALRIEKDLNCSIPKLYPWIFPANVLKRIDMSVFSKNIFQADEDDITLVQFFIRLTTINQLQIHHSLIIAASLRQFPRTHLLHLDIIYRILSVFYINVQTHTPCVDIFLNRFLQLRILDMIDLYPRQNPLKQ